MNNFGSVEFDRKNINLDVLSLEKLKSLLNEVNSSEEIIKQEIDGILKRLM